MTVNQLVSRYLTGAITAHELIVDCLNMLDPEDPSVVLQDLPLGIMPQLREFLTCYRQGENAAYMEQSQHLPKCKLQIVGLIA